MRKKNTSMAKVDFVEELNSMTFQERQAIEEDIHGVSEVIQETEDFVTQKIAEMNVSLNHMPVSANRNAWDRAVYLKPGLKHDRDHFLMFLRARSFVPFDAAHLLIKYYQAKREIWGDDLLIHRVTFQDLSPLEQEIATSGVYCMFPSSDQRDSTGRGIAITRMNLYDVGDPAKARAFTRAVIYLETSSLLDDSSIQRRGTIILMDFRGTMKSTKFQMLRYMLSTVHIFECAPIRRLANIGLNENTGLVLKTDEDRARGMLKKDGRARTRTLHGSKIELDYQLRSLGIRVGDCLDLSRNPSNDAMSRENMTKRIQKRLQAEEQLRQYQAPYMDPESPIAIFPNTQDILMGNKVVAMTWPGNVQFKRVISEEAVRYMVASHKTAMARNVVTLLRTKYQARFLTRTDTQWETMDPDGEVLRKVTQALRDEARKSITPLPIRK